MRILLVSSREALVPKFRWVAEGFVAAGHGVTQVHTVESLQAAEPEHDLVIFEQYGGGIGDTEIINRADSRTAKWVVWWFDLLVHNPGHPLAVQPLVKSFSRMMQSVDAVLVKERCYVANYREMGINAYWFDQACPADMPACEHSYSPRWDVLLWGSFDREQRRRDVMLLLDEGYSVAWAGHPGPDPPPSGCQVLPFTKPHDLPALANHAAMVLVCDTRTDIEGYWSDRIWMAAGMGACTVWRYPPGLPPELGRGSLYGYTNDHELLNTVHTLKTHPELRVDLGPKSRQHVLEKHTYRHRAEELLTLSL